MVLSSKRKHWRLITYLWVILGKTYNLAFGNKTIIALDVMMQRYFEGLYKTKEIVSFWKMLLFFSVLAYAPDMGQSI